MEECSQIVQIVIAPNRDLKVEVKIFETVVTRQSGFFSSLPHNLLMMNQ